jgi:uncharacterized membrane protein
MRQVSALLRSKLLSPILLTALLPLSFRSSTSGTHFVFLGGGRTIIALALWALCVTLTVIVIVKSRQRSAGAQA